jgi:hypothetical protein
MTAKNILEILREQICDLLLEILMLKDSGCFFAKK